MKNQLQAVLFDLDGTLIDTAPDFIRIINQLCQKDGITAPSDTAIREQVSAGARAMVRLILNDPTLSDDDIRLLTYRDLFLKEYEQNICIDSRIFSGLEEVLLWLETNQIKWGIVTNKPKYLARALLKCLDLTNRCQVLVCPDDVKNAKPDPESLLLACDLLQVNPANCLYVGDHKRDIIAGNLAAMTTVIASYGYIPPDDKDINHWGADKIIHTPNDLLVYCQSFIK